MSVSEKFCPQCGGINDKDAVFCNNCGNRFQQTQKEPQMTKQASPMQYTRPQSGAMGGTADKQSQHSQEYIKPPDNAFQGAIEFVRNTERAAPTLMMDPEAPSGFVIILVQALILGFIGYFTVASDIFFDELFSTPEFEQAFENSEVDIDSLRSTLAVTVGIFSGLGSIITWYIGSFIMGLLVKGGIPPQSPMRYNFGHAMRQQTAYRNAIYVPIQLLILIAVFMGSIEFYLILNQYIIVLGSLFSAYLVVKSFGTNVGYNGIGTYIFAGLIVLNRLGIFSF